MCSHAATAREMAAHMLQHPRVTMLEQDGDRLHVVAVSRADTAHVIVDSIVVVMATTPTGTSSPYAQRAPITPFHLFRAYYPDRHAGVLRATVRQITVAGCDREASGSRSTGAAWCRPSWRRARASSSAGRAPCSIRASASSTTGASHSEGRSRPSPTSPPAADARCAAQPARLPPLAFPAVAGAVHADGAARHPAPVSGGDRRDASSMKVRGRRRHTSR